MSAPINDGGPAFPHVGEQFNHFIGEREVVTTAAGITVRDYFAAKALPAIVTITGHSMHAPRDGMSTDDSMAADAYALADAMLKARAA